MPLNDAGYTIANTGWVYLAPVDTPSPSRDSLDNPPSPWAMTGHVGTEENDGAPEMSYDGGDKTKKGSWGKKGVRVVTEPITDTVEFSLSQIDRTNLGLYYGGTGGDTDGEFAISSSDPADTECAMTIIWRDLDNYFGVWYAHVSIARADSIELSSAEDPVMLPVAATVLDPRSGDGPRQKWLAASIAAPDESGGGASGASFAEPETIGA